MFVEIPELNANSVDPDQMPCSVASDLVYTVCQCPFYGMLGLNGLNFRTNKERVQISLHFPNNWRL